MPHKFILEQKVKICGNEVGRVIGCAEYLHSEDLYLIEYRDGSGTTQENWWASRQISAVESE